MKKIQNAWIIENNIKFYYHVLDTVLGARLTKMSKTCSLTTDNSKLS